MLKKLCAIGLPENLAQLRQASNICPSDNEPPVRFGPARYPLTPDFHLPDALFVLTPRFFPKKMMVIRTFAGLE